MVKKGRININDIVNADEVKVNIKLIGRPTIEDLEAQETATRIAYLLDHPNLRKKYPVIYDITLDKLYERYFERTGKSYYIEIGGEQNGN